MKKTFISAMRSTLACAMTALAISCFTACSSDDDTVTPAPRTFTGHFTTTLPSMPNFEALHDLNTAELTWSNAEKTAATIRVGAFNISIETPRGAMSYDIGEMTITDIKCTSRGNTIVLSQPEFHCMAGQFDTTGSLEGTLDSDRLTFTIVYKPGSMPFDVQSVFEGK